MRINLTFHALQSVVHTCELLLYLCETGLHLRGQAFNYFYNLLQLFRRHGLSSQIIKQTGVSAYQPCPASSAFISFTVEAYFASAARFFISALSFSSSYNSVSTRPSSHSV